MVMKWNYLGRDWSVSELSEEFGLSKNVIRTRLTRSSWSVEQAVTVRVMSPESVGRAGKRKSYYHRKSTVTKWGRHGS